MSQIPDHAQILVIGGGPGGSYTATLLAREGFDVVLFEAAHFPRYHVGESMLPSVQYFFKYIDLLDTLKDHGFTYKPGAAFKLTSDKREGFTDFVKHGKDNASWNVVRSEFDEMLLRNAQKSGVRVFEGTKVTALRFRNGGYERPVAAEYHFVAGENSSEKDKEHNGLLKFDYLVDASGRGGIMATKYLKNRHYTASLKNVASWGYWKGTKQYMPGTNRHNAPWFEANSEQSGWNWFIPLHNGYTSVGVVVHQDASNARRQKTKEGNNGVAPTAKEHYLDYVKLTPVLHDLIGDGVLEEDPSAPKDYAKLHQASDYSFNAPTYSGDHYRLVGDSAAFIDPFFSSGVHMAFTGGLAAAATIASSIRGEFEESECRKYHDAKINLAYTRFLIIVLSAYKQMHAQSHEVLTDVDSDGFDRAFELIRPVIQGHVDVGKRLTENEIQKTLDFCSGIFEPVTPEMQSSVAARVDGALLSRDAPLMTPEQIDAMVDNLTINDKPSNVDAAKRGNASPLDKEADLEVRQVLKELNAKKVMGKDGFGSIQSWSDEVAGGYVVRTERGKLGLVKV